MVPPAPNLCPLLSFSKCLCYSFALCVYLIHLFKLNPPPLPLVVPQSLVLKTPNNYDTGSAFLLSATGFFSPKFRVGEGTEVCQQVYISGISFQRYGLSGAGSGGHNILTQLKNVISRMNTCKPQKKTQLALRAHLYRIIALKFTTFALFVTKVGLPSQCFPTGQQHPISVSRAKFSEAIQHFDAMLYRIL